MKKISLLILAFFCIATASIARQQVTTEDDNNSHWKDYCEALMEDPWIMPGLGGYDQHKEEYQWKVPVQQNDTNSNFYRLVNPYKYGPAAPANYLYLLSDTEVNAYIYLDATDPEHVIIYSDNVFNNPYSMPEFYCYNYLGSTLTYYASIEYPITAAKLIEMFEDMEYAVPYTTFKDNKFTLSYVYNTEEERDIYDANYGNQTDPTGGNDWTGINVTDMTGSITFESIPTAVTNISNSIVAQKVVENGQVVIRLENSKKLNLQGAVIK